MKRAEPVFLDICFEFANRLHSSIGIHSDCSSDKSTRILAYTLCYRLDWNSYLPMTEVYGMKQRGLNFTLVHLGDYFLERHTFEYPGRFIA